MMITAEGEDSSLQAELVRCRHVGVQRTAWAWCATHTAHAACNVPIVAASDHDLVARSHVFLTVCASTPQSRRAYSVLCGAEHRSYGR
jgi:hypothetical protein